MHDVLIKVSALVYTHLNSLIIIRWYNWRLKNWLLVLSNRVNIFYFFVIAVSNIRWWSPIVT